MSVPTKCLYTKFINGFYVPCGKCSHCRKKIANEWSFRCKAEANNKYTYNLLLTYDEDHLPKYKGEPCLNKVHVQDFMKRFRYYVSEIFGVNISFFCVGEYGGKTHRPHYHMIIFSKESLALEDEYQFMIDIVRQCWRQGQKVNFEPIHSTSAQCFYMTAYLLNYDDGREYDKHNKPFKLMSRRPAIGRCWIDDNPKTVEYCRKHMNYTYKATSNNGKLFTRQLPRYIKGKIMSEEHQIYFADEYYQISQEFHEWLSNLNIKQKKDYANRQKFLQEREQRIAKDEYRKAKVHKNNRYTFSVSD